MRSDLIAQVNLDHLLHNYRVLRARLAPGVKLCAALKADAYGHGVRNVAPALQEAGVDCAAVATVPEAVELRQIGWKQPIMVLGNVLAVADEEERQERIAAIIRYQLAVTITDDCGLAQLAASAAKSPIEVHLKIDTGMGRMGVMPEGAAMLIRRIRSTPQVRLAGIYSHFATADLQLPELVRRQCAMFQSVLGQCGDILPPGILRHMANSAATIAMPEVHFDMVRPGLAMYGYWPAAHMADAIDLKPILRLLSHFSIVKELPANHCVGYGQTFTTKRQTRLGIVPIGYFDGYLRALSNISVVGIGDQFAPVIGRVSMDQLAVDVTDCPSATTGTEVVLIDDRPGLPNSVASLAQRLGTIPYEITCLLGRRIERISVRRNCANLSS